MLFGGGVFFDCCVPTYRLDLAYLGGGFHGWAAQPGSGPWLANWHGRCSGSPEQVTLSVAGRTDAGVHARTQVASFVLAEPASEPKLVNGLNSLLGPEVAVASCRLVEEGFHARFLGVLAFLPVLVLTSDAADPFLAATTWHYPGRLDLAAMDGVVRHLVGARLLLVLPGAAGTARRRVDAGWTMAATRSPSSPSPQTRSAIRWSARSLGSPPRWDGEGGPGCDTRHHPEPGPVGGSPGGSTSRAHPLAGRVSGVAR